MPEPLTVVRGAERRHDPGPEHWWGESWYFDFAAPDGSLGGYVRIGLYPNQRVAWYWAAVAGPTRPTVLVRDHEVPLPKAPGLEIRAEGLWGDHVCEEPLEHWSIGLEAFGVALDDPADAFAGELGTRTALGFDLEWETTGVPYAYPGVDRYEVPCRVHGEVLVGAERIELDAPGERDHSWGVRDWWQLGWWWTTFHLADGTAVHGMALDAEGLDYEAGFVQRPATPVETEPGFAADDELDTAGLLVSSRMRYGDRSFRVEPLAHAPLLLVDEVGGRTSRFARSYCRWTDEASAESGTGWYERNAPR